MSLRGLSLSLAPDTDRDAMCPDENQLLDLAFGLASGVDGAVVRQHLDTCENCRKLVAVATGTLSTVPGPDANPQAASNWLFTAQAPDTTENGSPLLEGRYVLRERLGQGGMGRVYAAFDTRLGVRIAVKFLLEHFAEHPEHAARLRREILLARRIHHRNVCRVYDLGQWGPSQFITMELIEGRSLGHALSAADLSESQLIEILHQIAEALAAAHAAGVVHRDLKPANVMLENTGRVVVMDFGLALDIGTETPVSAIVGTPGYCAPEQSRGERATFASDVYSFGVLGRTACATFLDPNGGVRSAAMRRLDEVLARASAQDPGARFRDGGALLLALRGGTEGRPVGPIRTLAWLGAALLALTMLTLTALATYRQRPSAEPAQGGGAAPTIDSNARATLPEGIAPLVDAATSMSANALGAASTAPPSASTPPRKTPPPPKPEAKPPARGPTIPVFE